MGEKRMRTFLIKVNGTQYEVEVEEISGAQSASAPVQYTSPQPAPASVPKPDPRAPSAAKSVGVPEGATEVKSPLPGTVLSVLVSVGDTVVRGDVLVMIEAMKMENEIMSPQDGKILAIAASKDDSVDTGDLLLVIG
jgi:glutaconyl-CoA/methylmalonyl-CoA decarboxylase subunit gamma